MNGGSGKLHQPVPKLVLDESLPSTRAKRVVLASAPAKLIDKLLLS